jgi:hypothetical protein
LIAPDLAPLRPGFAKMRGYARAMEIDRASLLGRRAGPGPQARDGRKPLARIAFLAALVLAPQVAAADWLGTLIGAARRVAAEAPSAGARALDKVAAHIRSLPSSPNATVLAAQATPEGHWRFVNKAGETITAGTPEEMRRVTSLLVPDARAEARLQLYLTEDTVFARRAAFKDLPRGSELYLFVADESYRILRRSEAANERLFAEIRPNLVVELSDAQQFAEAAWQLRRPLNKADIRVLALEPGSATRLASAPRLDPASKKALIDSIDPGSLAAALGAVRGQTVLITGRIDGELLHFKGANGPERSLLVRDLFKAAEQADVNLIVLTAASTPRQPGGRNWLWQKVEVKGLEEALQRARVADFYNALAPPNGRFAVTAKAAGHLRTQVAVVPIADLPKLPASRPLSDILGDAAASLTGRVITTGIEANIRSAAHQRDIDWRLFSVLPANVQLGYFALLLVGFLGVPLARVWWAHLWPPEDPAEYAGRTGYWAARLIRDSVFVAVFLPLTAPLSAPINLGRQVWDAILAPVRAWRWLTRGKRRAAAPSSSEAALGSSQVALGSPLSARHAAEAPSLGSYRPNR